MKNDWFYLEKIVADLKFIIDHMQGMTQAEKQENDLLIDSVMFRIVQIAENGAKLTDVFREAHPDIPWAAIRGMRNRIVNNYGVVSMTNEKVAEEVIVGLLEEKLSQENNKIGKETQDRQAENDDK